MFTKNPYWQRKSDSRFMTSVERPKIKLFSNPLIWLCGKFGYKFPEVKGTEISQLSGLRLISQVSVLDK